MWPMMDVSSVDGSGMEKATYTPSQGLIFTLGISIWLKEPQMVVLEFAGIAEDSDQSEACVLMTGTRQAPPPIALQPLPNSVLLPLRPATSSASSLGMLPTWCC